jgi:hypothetical protein
MRNSNSCNPANPSNKSNKTKNHNQCNNHNEQVKIYFPSISIQILQNALHDTPNSSKKQNQVKTKIDKHLYGETQKVIIYGTTSILEILNNQPYTIYPSDKIILSGDMNQRWLLDDKRTDSLRNRMNNLTLDSSLVEFLQFN